jgi:hypothetical protein
MVPGGHDVYSGARRREISAAGYRQLAEFRFRIRQFLHLSEEAARSKGIEPQQHQLGSACATTVPWNLSIASLSIER